MSDYIPTELLDEILVRLPVQSLVRFTSVCKSWYSLITSNSFIAKHLNHSKTSTKNLLLKHYNFAEKIEGYLLFPGDVKIGHEFSEVESPFSSSPAGYKGFFGSCNGLLCMVEFDANMKLGVILWNPSIRKSITLPMPAQRDFKFFVGLGAHPKTLEYMLVFIGYEKADVEHRLCPSKVELYTQGTGSWRSITSSGHPPHHHHHGLGDGFRNFIISFNMGSQAFLLMMMPAALVSENTVHLSIISYRESLALLSCGTLAEGSCCLWVMKEYVVSESWALYNISLQGVLRNIEGFRENGEVLVWTIDNLILWYNCETKTLTNTGKDKTLTNTENFDKYFGTIVRPKLSYNFFVDTFLESLILVKAGNGAF